MRPTLEQNQQLVFPRLRTPAARAVGCHLARSLDAACHGWSENRPQGVEPACLPQHAPPVTGRLTLLWRLHGPRTEARQRTAASVGTGTRRAQYGHRMVTASCVRSCRRAAGTLR